MGHIFNEDLAQTANFYRKLISETSHGDSKAEAQEQDLNYAVEAIIPRGTCWQSSHAIP